MFYVPCLDLSFGGSENILPIFNDELAGEVIAIVKAAQSP